MTWNVLNDYWQERLDEHFVFEGVPVLVHSVGTYPQLVNDAGETTRDTPHISIRHGGTYSARGCDYKNIKIVCEAGPERPSRRPMELQAWSQEFEKTPDIGPWIQRAKQHLPDAVTLLAEMPQRFADARHRISAHLQYPDALSREDYESACAELGIAPDPDPVSRVHGIYDFPHYMADQVLAYQMVLKRGRGISRAIASLDLPAVLTRSAYEQLCREHHIEPLSDAHCAADPMAQVVPVTPVNLTEELSRRRVAGIAQERCEQPTRKQGQLWEPCPRCGTEPVYMPLMLCETCWPKARP